MEWTQVATFAFQTVITVLIGAVGWGIKNAITELKNATQKNESNIKRVEEALQDLKSDLPLVYVLREDYIRVMNNVETKLDKLLSNNNNSGRDN